MHHLPEECHLIHLQKRAEQRALGVQEKRVKHKYAPLLGEQLSKKKAMKQTTAVHTSSRDPSSQLVLSFSALTHSIFSLIVASGKQPPPPIRTSIPFLTMVVSVNQRPLVMAVAGRHGFVLHGSHFIEPSSAAHGRPPKASRTAMRAVCNNIPPPHVFVHAPLLVVDWQCTALCFQIRKRHAKNSKCTHINPFISKKSTSILQT